MSVSSRWNNRIAAKPSVGTFSGGVSSLPRDLPPPKFPFPLPPPPFFFCACATTESLCPPDTFRDAMQDACVHGKAARHETGERSFTREAPLHSWPLLFDLSWERTPAHIFVCTRENTFVCAIFATFVKLRLVKTKLVLRKSESPSTRASHQLSKRRSCAVKCTTLLSGYNAKILYFSKRQ
jgi:hypothetical protein